ncbi:MAG: hypothetical protein LC797_10950 [Chloroflexi bacterium]|nr:hypothetical protein [Chloroflexota bacterium]
MDRHEDDAELDGDGEGTVDEGETHATTGGAAAAGAVTGGVIGLTGGPVGAALGAVGGAIIGAAAERLMHSDDDAERARTADLTVAQSEVLPAPPPLGESTPVERGQRPD